LNTNKVIDGVEESERVMYRSGDIDRRVLRGYTARLESVGLGLIRKLVCV
jgi:hypothetical protein